MILPIINLEQISSINDDSTIKSIGLTGDVIIRIPSINDISLLSEFLKTYQLGSYWVHPIKDINSNDMENVTKILDNGCAKIVIPGSLILSSSTSLPEKIFDIPSERLAVNLNLCDLLEQNSKTDQLVDKMHSLVSGYLIAISEQDLSEKLKKSFPENLFKTLENFIYLNQKNILSSGGLAKIGVNLLKKDFDYSLDLIKKFSDKNLAPVVPIEKLTLESNHDNSTINLADSFSCTLKSDRPDGLFITVVVNESDEALGVVYSSTESIREAIKTRTGVYQSRKRGLWHKGSTSGAVQELKKILIDCDNDSLKFVVKQFGSGFCHLNTQTCFGSSNGLSQLEQILLSRKASAPPGSYTQKLFQNPDLLKSKIMEEADELCAATSKEEIIWEAADLMYFTLAKCVANGVSLSDIESHLDKRAKKISRRPGDAKPKWDVSKKQEKETSNSEVDGKSNSVNQEMISMQNFILSEIDTTKRLSLLQRPIIESDDIMSRVRPIVDDVRKRGDKALVELTAKFDGVKLDSPVISAPFPPDAMVLDDDTRNAIDQAYENIYKFHEAQYDRSTLVVETMPGVVCSRFSRPIERVGLYVPGGTAILPSTTLMLGIPAKVAGCKQITIASPPRKDGSVIPEVLYVAHKVGASKVLLAGGAQAIAALAYGTESVPKVDKICGPGNQYVTAAKMLAQNDSFAMVSIDMPAGPSELLVIADNTSIPAYVASDLLSQAEHGTDSQVVLVTVSITPELLIKIKQEINDQAKKLPRVSIVSESIPKSFILQTDNMEEAIKFSNDYAPEHLILHTEEADKWIDKVENAGSVFIGAYSPESCGDYASGTNHTLPTYGYAKMYSGVNTLTFVKHITSQKLTKEGLNRLGDTVMRLAEVEGLEAHRNAVHLRIKDIRKQN